MNHSVLIYGSDEFSSVVTMAKQVVINASELHRATGKVLKRVAVNDEYLVVERADYPVTVMISYREYERFLQEHVLVTHRELVRALGQEAERQGLTEDQLMAELEEDKRAVYKEMYVKYLA